MNKIHVNYFENLCEMCETNTIETISHEMLHVYDMARFGDLSDCNLRACSGMFVMPIMNILFP